MEIKQCSPESSMGQGRNQGRNLRLPKIQWKWPHNIPKFMGHNESSVKRQVHNTKYLRTEAGKNPH